MALTGLAGFSFGPGSHFDTSPSSLSLERRLLELRLECSSHSLRANLRVLQVAVRGTRRKHQLAKEEYLADQANVQTYLTPASLQDPLMVKSKWLVGQERRRRNEKRVCSPVRFPKFMSSIESQGQQPSLLGRLGSRKRYCTFSF